MSTLRLPEPKGLRQRAARVAMGLLLVLPFFVVPGARAAEDERGLLLARQAALGAQFDAEERDCRTRFAVTSCVEEVQQRRREALAPVRESLLQLDEAERQRRAAARREELAAKARLRADRQAAALAAAAAASSASAPRPRQRMLPPAPPRPLLEDAPAEADIRAREAAVRAQATRQRQQEVAERQARIARRLAEREAANKQAVPLPPAPAASAQR